MRRTRRALRLLPLLPLSLAAAVLMAGLVAFAGSSPRRAGTPAQQLPSAAAQPALPDGTEPASPVVAQSALGASRAPTPAVASYSSDLEAIEAACGTLFPFFVTTKFAGTVLDAGLSSAPSIVAFRASAEFESGEQIVLADQSQTGSVYGLAFDHRRDHIYAAAYHKQGAAYGPGGPGGIYRIDMNTGAVELWASLPAGPDRHASRDDDAEGARWVGRNGLADIDLTEDGDLLLAANLYDGRIYQIEVPSGRVIGNLRHGASSELWRASTNIFGLGVESDWLYHGVVDLSGASLKDDWWAGHIYRSRTDGSEMEPVVSFDHGSPQWRDREAQISDIVFRREGGVIVGVRNRIIDQTYRTLSYRPPLGEILLMQGPDPWSINRPGNGVFTGGVAAFPGDDQIVATHWSLTGGLLWQDLAGWYNTSLQEVDQIELGRVMTSTEMETLPGTGDIEHLCPPLEGLDPERIAAATQIAAATNTVVAAATQEAEFQTATVIPATITANATVAVATGTAAALRATARAGSSGGTQTARAAVPTPNATHTAEAAAEVLEAVRNSCSGDNTYYAVTCFAQNLEPRQQAVEPALVAFNDASAAGGGPHFSLASQFDVGATFGLAYDWGRYHLYAGAYHKRATSFGPGGPGAIYRVDLNTGAVEQWAELPAGFDHHEATGNGTDFDAAAADWVGKVSLGDVEIDEARETLFAMNLHDRRIHRFRVPDGTYLGSFANGASTALWAYDARPFALGYRHGWLYHGVLNSYEMNWLHGYPVAYIYRSRGDGSEMQEVGRISMNYGRVPSWPTWTFGQAQTLAPMFTDIEFRLNGDLIGGFRERIGDASILSSGHGDILPLEWSGRSLVLGDPDRYQDRVRHPETTWGTLATVPFRDVVVATGVDPETIWSGGIFWFDMATGGITGVETIYTTDRSRVTDPTFGKTSGLGDVESLCPPPPTPTPTGQATSTVTLTPSPTATPTRTPEPIYLPVILGESCDERARHADVALVIDVSTSMRRLTRAERPKMEAVQDAARAFIGTMRLEPDERGFYDRVAVVGFNRSAWIQQPLTNDATALNAAVTALPERMAEYTRLDLALEVGGQALADARRSEDVGPVLILLTDGLPNQVPLGTDGTMESIVLDAADAVKAEDIQIFTVGVGRSDSPDIIDRINVQLLQDVATEPAMFRQAVDAEALRDIYAEIAITIGCPRGRHDWSLPWP